MNRKGYQKKPDRFGYFGKFGGRYVAETLLPALSELEEHFKKQIKDRSFRDELATLLQDFAGRPTPLYYAPNLTAKGGGGKIFLKREDLCHTGAHKINNTIGQGLLAMKMGKKRVIAETGAGQHGVATATICAKLGMECQVYMGVEDMKRQAANVHRMHLLGAEVVSVDSGSMTLKDAMNEAIRNWVTTVETTHYMIGSTAGPHPYPWMVRYFQSVIGREAMKQILKDNGSLPDLLVACVGGGSNSLGLFDSFIAHEEVDLVGVEAAGKGISSGLHAATLARGKVGVLHGSRSYVLMNGDGQIQGAHSISAGLDYPGVGPEHSFLKDLGRVIYVPVTDKQALRAFHILAEEEGILPALESAHAVAYALKAAASMPKDGSIIVNLSGRGDKDMDTVIKEG